MGPLLRLVDEYLNLVRDLSADRSAFERLLHAEFTQIEFPSALNPTGQTSDRGRVSERLQAARLMLAAQKLDVVNHCEDDRQVFVEAIWTGHMAVDVGPLKRGQTVRARICMAFEFRDGKLFRQRNYDCFDRFDSPSPPDPSTDGQASVRNDRKTTSRFEGQRSRTSRLLAAKCPHWKADVMVRSHLAHAR